ncbi:MAG: fused MFS/spermidine synthase [Sedimentisphaerales bacterium]|nr:fused MFS/spermidine synthase [Sedimentisphaerales bacterium]
MTGNNKMRATGVIFIACVCGWFVMELEILGVRALAPYFGSAVYVVMGSVVGVFLLSLSAGYMSGGWLSKKVNIQRMLGINLILCGTWLFAMPAFIEPVCDGMYNIGLDERWGSLLAAIILFGLPTMLLGTVTPSAVQWLTRQASDSGVNAGLVLALSTTASFAGCVVTAFYLVLVSLRLTIRISGIILFVLGCAILVQAVLRRRRWTSSS